MKSSNYSTAELGSVHTLTIVFLFRKIELAIACKWWEGLKRRKNAHRRATVWRLRESWLKNQGQISLVDRREFTAIWSPSQIESRGEPIRGLN